MTNIIWASSAHDPGSTLMPYPVTDTELARIEDFKPTVYIDDQGDPIYECVPFTDTLRIEGEAAGGRALLLRHRPCGLPECDCALEAWTPTGPPPPPAASHHAYDPDNDECQCGRIAHDMDRYGYA